MSLPGFQDAEQLAITYLAGLGMRAASQLPANPTYPLITITRRGGLPVVRGAMDAARLSVSVWALTKADAHDTAAAAQSALWVMPDAVAGVTHVEDDLGLAWNPDDYTTPARPRYIFGVVAYIRTAEPTP